MKVTIYELLGMVKDGKELPKKVKVLDVIYEFDDHYGDYFNKSLDRYLFVYMTSEEERKLAYFLNAQVEIIEEEKKIPEKLEIINEKNCKNNWKWKVKGEEYYYNISKPQKIIADKINQVIDYLKSKGE